MDMPEFTKTEYDVLLRAIQAYAKTHPSQAINDLLKWMELVEDSVVPDKARTILLD